MRLNDPSGCTEWLYGRMEPAQEIVQLLRSAGATFGDYTNELQAQEIPSPEIDTGQCLIQ